MSVMKSISYLIGLLSIVILASCRTNYNVQSNHSQPPNDGDKIKLSFSEGINNNYKDFEKLGYQPRTKIPDFTLFSPDGVKFRLAEVLAKGKPVVLITGSYTCDISRHNIGDINTITARYKDKLSTYVVYTIEAHPSDVASPYSKNNRIDLAQANIREHIDAQQAKTYSERKAIAKKWQQQNSILAPVLVDNPTNDFWLAFGQAPNMAYLIEPDGTVYYKQAWFKYVSLDNAIKDLLQGRPKNHISTR